MLHYPLEENPVRHPPLFRTRSLRTRSLRTRSLRTRSLRTQQVVFFGGISAAVLAILLIAVITGARYAVEFDRNLNLYFRIHDLRVAIAETHRSLDGYVRTRDPLQRDRFTTVLPTLWQQYNAMEPAVGESLEAYFETNATYYGLNAYQRHAAETLVAFEDGSTGYYLQLEQSNRIRGYLDWLRPGSVMMHKHANLYG